MVESLTMESRNFMPRLLCLHGHGSNDTVTAAQLQNLGFDRYFDVHHLTAPWQCTGTVDESIRSLCPNGPFRSWVHPDGNSLSNLVESLQFVLNHIISHGPYDAVYGFSHGAGIAALLSCDAIRAKLCENCTPNSTESPWKFIFAACASFPCPLQDIQDHFDIKKFSVSVPGAHMIGIQDPLKNNSEALLDTFRNDETHSLPIYFDGGHEISSDTESLEKVSAAAIDWFSKHCPNELKHKEPEYSLLRGVTEEMHDLALDQPEGSSIGGKIGQYQLNKIPNIDSDLNLASMLKRKEIQDQIAFRSPGRTPITYGELWKFVRNEGNLSTVGCKQGDKVAYLVPFGIVGAAAFISIAIQCQAIPLDPESNRANLDDALRQLRPDVFILFDDLGNDVIVQAQNSAASLGIRIVYATGRTDQKHPFVFLNRESNHDSTDSAFLENKGNEICLLLRTSGTTSQPKVVPLQTSSLVSNALAIANNLGLHKNDVGLNGMPLFHIGGLMTNLLASFVSGGSTIFLPKFDAFVFIRTLTNNAKIKPTWFSAVPTMLAAVETLITHEEANRSSLRFIRVGAAAISEDLIRQLQLKFGCRVIPTYSMTECMPISQPPSGSVLVDERPGSVGQGLNVSISVVDSNLVPLPRSKMIDTSSPNIGEICISGPTVMAGYISNTSANQDAFFRLGKMTWFRTGDLGYLDADGFLYITGRRKEMIKINAEQVSPIEIEEACMKFSKFKSCVAFSQPSGDNWGEQIGVACVLLDDSEMLMDHSKLKNELKIFLKREGLLPNWKIPKRIELVSESSLPKTRSGKYIRVGLSEVLDKISSVSKPTSQDVIENLSFHKAAYGVQYVLAVAVMYVHIGNLDVWAAPTSQDFETYVRADTASDWSNTRTWCLHTPLFFFVGGFLLATGTQSPIITKESLMNFYKIRILSLHPMYLVSILLCIAIFIPRCHPGNYTPEFDPNRKPLEGDNFVCQATPVEMSWGLTLVTSTLNYAFLLQSWFFTVPFSWFLSYYTWFSSSYIFCIFVFPWCHKPFFAARDNRRKLWKLMMMWVLVLYSYIAVLAVVLSAIEKEALFNRLVLSFYMLPPGWVPCFSIGIGACFILKNYLKTTTQVSSARKWGIITDLLSFIFLLGWIGYGLSASWARPSFAKNTELGNRYWAAFVSRLICPVGFLWYVGLCIGRGATGWLLSGTIIVDWLAPASYNIFLFHGPVSEIYFRITRGMWWSFPKSFYWFSPYPVPVQKWEIPVVMAIVTVFSVFMHFFINDKLVAASHRCLSCFQRQKTSSHPGTEKEVTDIVKDTVARIGNVDPTILTGETDLTEIGISSMALPVAISEINSALKPFQRFKKLSSSSLSLSRHGSTTVNALILLASEADDRVETRDTSTRMSNFSWNSGIELDPGHGIGLDIEEGGAAISG